MRNFVAASAGIVTLAALAASPPRADAGSRSGPDVRPVVVPDADRRSVEDGNLAFALASYRALGATSDNVAYSPLGVSTVLAMTMAGARGETRDQLATALGLTLPAGRLDAAFQSVLADLRPRGAGVVLETADGLFLSRDFSFQPGYAALLKRRYGAQAALFSGPDDAVRQVNRWAARRTHGMIPTALGAVDPATAALVANVVYLDAKWADPFDPRLTEDGTFVRADGSLVTVPMMQREGPMSVYSEFDLSAPENSPKSAVQVAEFPYKDRDWSMLVVVPRSRDALPDVEASLTPQKLKAWIDGLAPMDDVAVTMPRFELSTDADVVPAMRSLGLSDVFDPTGAADLSGIGGAPGGLYLSLLKQVAKIRVNERGTRAAAVTIVGVSITTELPAYPLALDRPFLFLVRHRPTGTILFIGRVADPSVKS